MKRASARLNRHRQASSPVDVFDGHQSFQAAMHVAVLDARLGDGKRWPVPEISPYFMDCGRNDLA